MAPRSSATAVSVTRTRSAVPPPGSMEDTIADWRTTATKKTPAALRTSEAISAPSSNAAGILGREHQARSRTPTSQGWKTLVRRGGGQHRTRRRPAAERGRKSWGGGGGGPWRRVIAGQKPACIAGRGTLA